MQYRREIGFVCALVCLVVGQSERGKRALRGRWQSERVPSQTRALPENGSNHTEPKRMDRRFTDIDARMQKLQWREYG